MEEFLWPFAYSSILARNPSLAKLHHSVSFHNSYIVFSCSVAIRAFCDTFTVHHWPVFLVVNKFLSVDNGSKWILSTNVVFVHYSISCRECCRPPCVSFAFPRRIVAFPNRCKALTIGPSLCVQSKILSPRSNLLNSFLNSLHQNHVQFALAKLASSPGTLACFTALAAIFNIFKF